ncbi:hypothetical protein H7J93_28230 [Mycobacterium barrassiae]|uniref:hypothetical protein n=1 Tax=Mycobacterium barrassiae TaxID=319709 RepID=UPI002265A41C|nr:hypothetical protein [Mycobacterium barrassiae]MCV7303511.1 hypothetical protein [Mycobacterium barrassiae]
MSMDIDIKEAVKGLIVAAGMAASVTQADIAKAAEPIVRNHPKASLQQVEAEIARRLRNQG